MNTAADFLAADRIRVRYAFMSTSGAVMVDKRDEIQQEAELRQEERRPWERPVLSEASLRNFTFFNNMNSDDNTS
jgi:hypothetical protein